MYFVGACDHLDVDRTTLLLRLGKVIPCAWDVSNDELRQMRISSHHAIDVGFSTPEW